MSLDWDVSNVKNYETLCFEEDPRPSMAGSGLKRTHPVTEALVYHCMGVGMRGITEANVDEFFGRVHFVELHQGSSVKRPNPDGEGWEDRYITREDVVAHIGLTTNVTNEALGRWLTRNFRFFYGLKVN